MHSRSFSSTAFDNIIRGAKKDFAYARRVLVLGLVGEYFYSDVVVFYFVQDCEGDVLVGKSVDADFELFFCLVYEVDYFLFILLGREKKNLVTIHFLFCFNCVFLLK